MALSSAIEPLRAANRLLGLKRYDWSLLGEAHENVTASNGIGLNVGACVHDAPTADLTVVLASLSVETYNNPAVFAWLRDIRRRGRLLGAISSGALLLARAGVARDARLTIHWELAGLLAESFPDITVTHDLYCWDKGILSAAGGTAAMDMMLELISQMDGRKLAMEVADQFLHGEIRPASQIQRQDLRTRFGVTDQRLLSAVEILERQIPNPVRISAVAREVGISERQLERLFLAQLDMTPGAFLLDLRLSAARRMILSSTESLERIAESCGFSSLGHFSRAFKARFGEPPSHLRRHRPHRHDGLVQGNGEPL